ncbi:uncharacterized protein GLRG_10122 [Colletotrichum graminicola M1.001]|uniref:Uncharacterized protein n=1 Tax=Colletotrichum graminicola (strain M1.001 / M2 / FGSC 10212) TaxID=645133 RepID=E3QVU0_COLGM|nr:uncharacterized protein GLRG_10122 [Colletotrichum graminicola M1.001]EFQ34978.1 hypothetical protein GLRG_10122 [Colletotrichum graminicola M1.001]
MAPFTDEEYFLNKPPDFELQRRARLPWTVWDRHSGCSVEWVESRENGTIPARFEGGPFFEIEFT